MPADRVYNVLFLCTGNSARSILGEALLNQMGAGRFRAYSAGSQPSGSVHPMAVATLEHLGIPVDGFHSKSWDEFADADAAEFDFIFTVCDDAAGETCPVWPGNPATAHCGVADPVAVDGDEEHRKRAFHDAAMILKRRIELLLALPLDRLDALSLHHHLKEIGQA